MRSLPVHPHPTVQVMFWSSLTTVKDVHRIPRSAECRHIFCAMCLLSWWQTKRVTSCPTCRTIAQSPPVRDPVQGFIALARVQAGEGEDSDPFDSDIFDSFFKLKTRASGSGVREVIEIP